MRGGESLGHNTGEQLQLKYNREGTARDVGEESGRKGVVTESR